MEMGEKNVEKGLVREARRRDRKTMAERWWTKKPRKERIARKSAGRAKMR